MTREKREDRRCDLRRTGIGENRDGRVFGCDGLTPLRNGCRAHSLKDGRRSDDYCGFVVTPSRNRSITNMVRNISFIALLHPNKPYWYFTTATTGSQEFCRLGRDKKMRKVWRRPAVTRKSHVSGTTSRKIICAVVISRMSMSRHRPWSDHFLPRSGCNRGLAADESRCSTNPT